MHVSLIQVPRLPPAAPEHQMTLNNTKQGEQKKKEKTKIKR